MSYRVLASEGLNKKALAFFRIALGLLVTIDTLQALGDFFVLYSDEGLLRLSTLHAAEIGSGMLSLHFACRWWPWSLLLLFLQLCCAVCLTLGFRSQRAALFSAVLLYSLLGRNPYVVGLEDGWIVLLLLTATCLPVGEEWGMDGRVWKACRCEPLDWYLCLGATLLVQGAAARELLLNSVALNSLHLGPLGRFWAFATVFGIYLLHQKGMLRGGGIILLASQSLWLFGPGRAFLVAVIALSSLWPCWVSPHEEEGQTRLLGEIASTLVVLELWSFLSFVGVPLPPVLTVLQADRALKTARVVFLVERETGRKVSLNESLPHTNYRVERFLSSSGMWDHRHQWRDLATYYDRARGVTSSGSYIIAVQPVLTVGSSASARVVKEVRTRAAPPPLFENFPRMDRSDVNKPQTRSTKPEEKLSGDRY